MNDFEKIFSEKLHHHKTPPPANGWEQLNAALDKSQNARKKVIYWRVAATILLLLVAGAAWWGVYNKVQEAPVADETTAPANEPKLLEEHRDTSKEQLALELEKDTAPADLPEKRDDGPEESINSVAENKSEEKEVEKKQHTQTAQPGLASAEVEAADTTEIHPIERIEPVETLAVEPLTVAENELLALETVKARVSSPVTIIYKPGNQTSDKVEENDEKSMALELLNDIKNTNISFLDIRNAKAELLAKVFNKKENEVTP